jgi:hypothetical protein
VSLPKPCEHDSHELYERLIGPIREKARELGYAVGVHGTLKRDIDLIAVPWTRDAVPPASSRRPSATWPGRSTAASPTRRGSRTAGGSGPAARPSKPHGRLCWTYHLGGGPYIDLSVMPRWPDAEWTCGDPECGCLNSVAAGEACWSCGKPREC